MLFLLIVPHSLGVLYFGTAAFGLFLSSIYPSTISLTEQFVSVGRKYFLGSFEIDDDDDSRF